MGRLFTWGQNTWGQLGDGTTVDKYTPTEITYRFNLFEDEKIEYISVNYFNPSAITSMGRIFTWSTTPTDITSSFDLSSNESIIVMSEATFSY